MESTNNNSKKGLGIGISIITLGLMVFIVFSQQKKTDAAITPATNNDTPAPVTIPVTPPIDTPKTTSSTYKDGTYTAVGSYMSPGGRDKIGVTLTLKADTITHASVAPQAGDNTSARYENIFATNYKQYVVGKNIATLNLTKVSGSSLTPKGFNDAITKIKLQAKV
jgi:uncharacterized protein with FMN-binding domain